MAVQPFTADQLETLYGHTHLITWGPLGSGDTGVPLEMSGSADRSVHFYGNFDGATVTLQGTNERAGTTIMQTNPAPANPAITSPVAGSPSFWATLHDPLGNNLSATQTKIDEFIENVAQVRPSVTGGTAQTAIYVAVCVRRPK